jgi:hypothetical protein
MGLDVFGGALKEKKGNDYKFGVKNLAFFGAAVKSIIRAATFRCKFLLNSVKVEKLALESLANFSRQCNLTFHSNDKCDQLCRREERERRRKRRVPWEPFHSQKNLFSSMRNVGTMTKGEGSLEMFSHAAQEEKKKYIFLRI